MDSLNVQIKSDDSFELQKRESNNLMQLFKKLDKKQIIFLVILGLIFLIIMLILFLVVFKSTNSDNQSTKQYFKKPLYDFNSYEVFNLSNHIKLLIINKHNLSNELGFAVAINGLGSLQDPQNNQGLSHFLEGSKNYYGQNYIVYQYSQGAYVNGYTDINTTHYLNQQYNNSMLVEGAKRVADFLKYPSILEQNVKSEINIIESENKNYNANNELQVNRLLQIVANPKSAFHQFFCGSTKSLAIAVENMQHIIDFHKKYYVTDNLFVVAQLNDNQFEKTKLEIKNIFESIPQTVSISYQQFPTAFNKNLTHRILKLKQKSNQTVFYLVYNIPLLYGSNTKSLQFIIQGLQVFSNMDYCTQLFAKMLILDCQIYSELISKNEAILFIKIVPAQPNFQFDTFIVSFKQYIKKFQQSSVTQEHYNTIQLLNQKYFDEQQQGGLNQDIYKFAQYFQENQSSDFLYQNYDFHNFSSEEVNFILNFVQSIDNLIIIVRGNQFTQIQTQLDGVRNFLESNSFIQEDIQDVEYASYNISEEEQTILNGMQIEMQWTFTQNTSEINSNIIQNRAQSQKIEDPRSKPTKFSPQIISSNNFSNFWYFFDSSFAQGICFYRILIESQHQQLKTIDMQVAIDITIQMFNAQGNGLQASRNTLGIILSRYFYSSKGANIIGQLEQFLNIEKLIIKTDIDFNYYKSKAQYYYIIKKESNAVFEAQEILEVLLNNYQHTTEKKYINLQSLTFSRYKELMNQFWEKINVEIFLGGNLNQQVALQYYQQVISYFNKLQFSPLSKNDCESLRISKIPGGIETYTLRVNTNFFDKYNVAVINYYQIGFTNLKNMQILNFLKNLFNSMAFSLLRNQNQLGYIASSYYTQTGLVDGLVILLQSSRNSTHSIDQQIEKVFDLVWQQLELLSDQFTLEQWQQERGSPYSYQFPNLNSESEYVWNSILSRTNNSINVKNYESISKNDIKSSFTQWFKQQSAKISIQLQNKYRPDLQSTDILTNLETYSNLSTKLFSNVDNLITSLSQQQYIIESQSPNII